MAWFKKERQSVKYARPKKHYLAAIRRVFPAFQLSKLVLFLLCLPMIYLVQTHWQEWLYGLDDKPIRAYALTHKTQFTKNADIRTALAKKPAFENVSPTVRNAIKSLNDVLHISEQPETLKGFFEQNIQDVALRLKQIPWINDVVVRKIYPDRLSITLFEHQPIALWNNSHYLSSDGTIFSLPADRFKPEGLPILFGPDEKAKAVLTEWSKLREALKQRNLTLHSVAMDSRGALSVTLDNQVELRFGREDWLPKIERFVTIFPEIEIPEGKRLAYVDLRYDDGASVGFTSQ